MASDFDPFTQNLIFHHADGTPFPVPLASLNDFIQYGIRICINYGAQLGASIILFVILMLLTRPEKRGSHVFILNSLSLFFNIGRLLCQVIYFTTGFENPYALFAEDYSRVGASAYADSILGVVLTFLMLLCIEGSLVLQVQLICVTLRRMYRRAILGSSILMALIPIGFRLAYTVENSMQILGKRVLDDIQWLESATNIVITVSICFFCAIFVTKLGFAIKQRERLGVRDFGPMKVIFVMGCQTLVIPALFSILQYATTTPELSSNVLTLVSISLPLSSIWAGFSLTKKGPAFHSSSSSSARNLWNMLSFQTSGRGETTIASQAARTHCFSDSRPIKEHFDLESGGGISVEHDISVHSYHKSTTSEAEGV
ncbi:hypothetical protein ASPZODRAFT_153857 [Penicilliopsis zonata CBS 506.65]|uniref:G-protein coupled receptors family 1 profile domain-containing protein n=1 Tax=Penicilliopsis zonata CBS 506.65 TaxID=1073090 RepID=A0A1L9SB61_9EURO|nr:hypothetical protein ASPZODRAFT_153857 [Penicilliopsis zonata CBS 506.65]OJJ44420.1 hypothetical protein ASPZODRAFT_153857 [Penicilliopsis zonata CBS 506.65]